MRHEDILLSVFVAVEGAHAYSAFNPSIFTIRRFPDSKTLRDIRTGYAYASVFTVGLGALVAGITRNALPVDMACLTAAGMSAVYEVTARRALSDGTKAPAWGV